MDEYQDIETAAQHRDWTGCARLMFLALYRRPDDTQRQLALEVLRNYTDIWRGKHRGLMKQIPDQILGIEGATVPDLPDFPDDLDPADAEFEDALIEFYNGAFHAKSHEDHTLHFASAIRSAVTARQIDRWIREQPDSYAAWKDEREFDGPSFLEDAAAADEAQVAWEFVDDLFKRHTSQRRAATRSQLTKRATDLYFRWEASLV